MSNGTITMTGAEYDALASKISTLEVENAKLRAELAGLLRTIGVGISKREMPTEQQMNAWFDQIDAALAEINK